MEIVGDGYYDKLLNKWWEDFNGESNVLIDDIGPDCIGAQHIKRWTDKRKFKAEKKFGSIDIRPLVIVITSNYHPREIWPKPEDHLPIMDRMQIIHLEGLHKSDDSVNKRKASKELPTRPKLVRRDALLPFIVPDDLICADCNKSPCNCNDCVICYMTECICDIIV